MNQMVNDSLLAGDKFTPEMPLRQPTALSKPEFTYSACGSFIKNKERIQKFKETGDSQYIYQNNLDKASFHHDITHGSLKDLSRITASDNLLQDKAQ